MERYIFVHEYIKGSRIAVTVEGEITFDLLDALEGYVKRHKAMMEPKPNTDSMVQASRLTNEND